MSRKVKKSFMVLAAVFAIAVGSAVIANAASNGDKPRQDGPGQGETPLTGDAADKVTAAAKDKVPGGTSCGSRPTQVTPPTRRKGDAAYEAHVRKSDGTERRGPRQQGLQGDRRRGALGGHGGRKTP